MKKIAGYCLFLSLIAAGTVSARTVGPTINNKNTEAAPATTTASNTTPAASNSAAADEVYNEILAATDVRTADDMITAGTGNNDSDVTTATLEVTPGPARGIMAIKTQCAGKVHFYTKKGKEKGVCAVAEGTNMIDVATLLFPGTYTCRFEGVNGAVVEAQLVYKL